MKNRKNDGSDTSLHVDHLGEVHFVPVQEPVLPPGRLSEKKVSMSPGSGSRAGDKNTQSVV